MMALWRGTNPHAAPYEEGHYGTHTALCAGSARLWDDDTISPCMRWTVVASMISTHEP